MDLRPQAHDIIRTWLFSSVLRSHYEHGTLPWAHAAISGWILDPDRKKMSKSKGNVVVPTELLEQFGSDAVRYWAASARLGTDTAFDPGQMKIGRRLALKLLNASKFALGLGTSEPGTSEPGTSDSLESVTEPVDRDLLAGLATVVEQATADFEQYDYARALKLTEEFFWRFCDDYLELVKDRAYADGPGADSARTTLRTAVSVLLRLFAPFLPYACEEAWSWGHSRTGALPEFGTGSVHRSTWPEAAGLRAQAGAHVDFGAETAVSEPSALSVLAVAADVLGQIRKAKSDAKRSVRAEVARVTVRDIGPRLAAVQTVREDLRSAGNVAELITVELSDGAEANVEVQLLESHSSTT
jgi:valyl-tRNA synthetase